MIRICFVTRQLGYGGAERQLLELLRGLDREKFCLSLILLYSGGNMEAELATIPDLKVIRLDKAGRWDWTFFPRFIKALRELMPDIIHGYLYLSNVLCVLAQPFLKKKTKVVFGIRSSNDRWQILNRLEWAVFFLQNLLSRKADLIIANSEAGKRSAIASGVPEDRLFVVHNGIDTERFRFDLTERKRIRKEWGVGEDETIIGLVARLDPKKGHSVFLQAATILARKGVRVRFVCVGDGNPAYRESLLKLAAALGIADKLLWIAATSDLTPVYCALDISTLCSNSAEGFPNVVAEAMACERPFVTSNCGDAALIVADIGIVVNAAKPEEFVEAWSKLMDQDRQLLGRKSRERIVTKFSRKALVASTTNLLERIVE